MTSKAVGYTNPISRTSSAFLSLARHNKRICNRNRDGITSVTDEQIELCIAAQPKDGEANTAVYEICLSSIISDQVLGSQRQMWTSARTISRGTRPC